MTRIDNHPAPISRRQRGVALIMVLLVVAVITILAATASGTIQFNIKKAQNRSLLGQAYWYALGGETIALQLLDRDINQDNRIHLQQSWAQSPHRYPFDGGGLELRIEDQQACFNINALASLSTEQVNNNPQPPLLLRQFRALLTQLALDAGEVEQLAAATLDWLDSDVIPTGPEGAEDLYYTNLQPAYLSANLPFTDLSELHFVANFKELFLQKLQPYLCALPNKKLQLNINSLTEPQAPILSALFENRLDTGAAARLIAERPSDGWRTVEDFWQLLPLNPDDLDQSVKTQLTVRSEYFLAHVAVNYYDAQLNLQSAIAIREGKFLAYARRYGDHR